MVEYLVVPASVKLQVHRNVFQEQFFIARSSNLPAIRIYLRGNEMKRFSSWKAPQLVAFNLRILNGSSKWRTPITGCCLNALTNAGGALTFEWVPFVDQVILLASITLTYMAGVIPAGKYPYNTQKSISIIDVIPANSSSATTDDEAPLQFAWDVVRGKLMDSSYAINKGVNISERVGESEQNPSNQPSTLCSIAEGPRIRLLWTSLKWLNKEVATGKASRVAALQQWLHQNMAAVVSIYEDQFDLCTLQSQLIEESNGSEGENFGWWKKLIVRRSGQISSSLRFVVISHVSLPVKRTKELRALIGWRYYFSLFLELTDITMPFVKAAVAKVSDVATFFLVCLIGRSLGLIYSGIRNSSRWK
ncbi:hypothetical protein OROGR_027480 [Orobanche gracilis]